MKIKFLSILFAITLMANDSHMIASQKEEIEEDWFSVDVQAPKPYAIQSTALLKQSSEPDWLEPKDLNSFYGKYAYDATKEAGIRVSYLYTPAQVASAAKRIVLIVVHGTGLSLWGLQTGGAQTPDYFNIETQSFKEILDFATQYADRKKAPIEVISFQWTGDNNAQKRDTAAGILGELVRERYVGYDIVTLSHSHGGNVVNALSQSLGFNPITLMLQLATPVREENEGDLEQYAPNHFKTLMQFWSPNDPVVPFGSFSTLKDLVSGKGSIRKFTFRARGFVYNIRIQIDGIFPGHSFIADVTPYLNTIVNMILNHYQYHHDLDLNIDTKNNRIMISIRHTLEESEFYKKFLEPRIQQDPNLATYVDKTEELAFSKQQEDLYRATYNKDMHEAQPLMHGILRTSGSLFNVGAAYVASKLLPMRKSGN